MAQPAVRWALEAIWLDLSVQQLGSYRWEWLAKVAAMWIAFWCPGISFKIWRQIES